MPLSSGYLDNVVSFYRDDSRANAADDFLSAFDSQDGAAGPIQPEQEIAFEDAAVDRVVAMIQRLMQAPDGIETIGFALDGLITAERPPAQQAILEDIIAGLEGESLGKDPENNGFIAPRQVVVHQSDDPDADIFSSVFVPPTESGGQALVVLSDALGFRESQLELQDQVATAFADYASTAGIELAPGDAGIRIARALRGEPDALGGLDTDLTKINLTLDGADMKGFARR